MSTKLYHAWRLADDDVLGVSSEVHHLLARTRDHLECVDIVEAATHALDKHFLSSSDRWDGNPVVDAYMEMLADRSRYRPDEVFSDPNYAKLVFCTDPGGVGAYAVLLAGNGDFARAIDTLWWTDFSYWDNTDRPDDVPADEWNHRRDVWNRILSAPGGLGAGMSVSAPTGMSLDGLQRAHDLGVAREGSPGWRSPRQRLVRMVLDSLPYTPGETVDSAIRRVTGAAGVLQDADLSPWLGRLTTDHDLTGGRTHDLTPGDLATIRCNVLGMA